MIRNDDPLPCLRRLGLILVLVSCLAPMLSAQVVPAPAPPVPAPTVPTDFTVHAQAGSVSPDYNLYVFDLAADGTGTYCVVPPANRGTGDCGTVTAVSFSPDQVSAVYSAVQAGNFFSLPASHIGNAVDGTFAELTITAQGNTHKVLTQNLALTAFDDIMLALNAALPSGSKVVYNEILDQL